MLQSSPANLSAAEHARLNSWMIDIAGEACGTPIGMGGQWRFGSNRSGLCVFDNGQFHDYSGGAHGFSTFELIEHLYPGDPVEWARAWLDEHPGNGSFVPGESEPDADFAEVEATAYINSLYNGAARIDDTPGYIYLTATESRGLPLRPEDAAQLRWIANYRGEEGALLVPVTDDEGELVKLLVIIVTPDGSKSSWFSRSTIRGAKRPGLVRFGTPGPNVVETEGVEKGLAARAAGSPYVVVTSGASNLGKVALPTVVRRVVIARDADPAGSESDKALWRGVVLRASQQLQVVVTARPSDIAPQDAPFLKDLDDAWGYDPELVPRLINGANLDHGRLGDAVCDAVLELLSRLEAVPQGYAKKIVASFLGMKLGTLNDDLERRVRERIERRGEPRGPPDLKPWAEPVTDIGAVLNDAVRIMKKFVAAPDWYFDTTALWSLHTHLIHKEELGVDVTPRLGFQSKEEDSGKTTFMKLVRLQVPRPKGVGSLTGSSLFRAVDARRCTLLVDEADYAFRADANPDLLAIFNSGNDRTFAFVSRSVPMGDGEFEDHDFCTFGAMCFTSIDKLATKSMQSRCIALTMRPATKEEAARLVRFHIRQAQNLKDCGREFARWAADSTELPEVEPPDHLVNRIADNWRSLFQIAALAGGDWPARVLAAAQADAAGDEEEPRERGADGLLGAIWRIFAAQTTNPRQMFTEDLVRELMKVDDGRWRVANKGKQVDDYFLREKLKGYVVTKGKWEGVEIPLRQWRPGGNQNPKKGYHELHFADAFLRYLGKELPSKAPSKTPEAKKDKKGSVTKPSFPPSLRVQSATSGASGVLPDNSITCAVPDAVSVADAASDTGDVVNLYQMSHPHQIHPSDTDKIEENQHDDPCVADVLDAGQTEGGKEERTKENKLARLPRGPVGRKRSRE